MSSPTRRLSDAAGAERRLRPKPLAAPRRRRPDPALAHRVRAALGAGLAHQLQPEGLRTGIRHSPSGTVTIIDVPLRQVIATLIDRLGRISALDGSHLEAILVDHRREVCATFWP